MNPPLFELTFEHGPFDGWQVTTNYLPTESLALPTRPDRATSLRNACQGGALSHASEPHAHYALAGKQMILVHGIPVVRMRFRFDSVLRQQRRQERPVSRKWLSWLPASLAWWQGRRSGTGLPQGAELPGCGSRGAQSLSLSGRVPGFRG